MPITVAIERIGPPRRWALTLIGISALGVANIAQAQTLGAVEQRLDRLEKVTRELQRETDRSSRSSNSRDDVYMQLDRRLSALERAISRIISAQEHDQYQLTTAREQLHRMKGDVENRLDAVEGQVQQAEVRTLPSVQAESEPARQPADADALFREGMSYVNQGDWTKAEFTFDTFIASYPTEGRIAEARYQLGRAFQGQAKHAQAAQIFLDLFEKYPDAPFAVANLFALGEALSKLGPESTKQACDVYGEIDVAHGSDLSNEQRALLLDRRLSLKCSD